MATKKKKTASRSRVADRRLREGLDEAEALMERHRWLEARGLLNELTRTYPQRQEILRHLITVAVPLDDTQTYHWACEHLYTLCPNDPHLPFMLTMVYLKYQWFALALSM